MNVLTLDKGENVGPKGIDKIPLYLFVVTILSRIPFKSEILTHWDSVQFALATERYDITVHHPHPPGYFLYVMAGKILNLFTGDPNLSFVLISILFSGLTVSAIYLLAQRIYDRQIAFWSSLLAMTSPLFWFFGEVAMSYIVEAFFTTFFALLCFRIIKGENYLIWASALTLAIAGGIRQSALAFLFPLWIFSIRKAPVKYILLSGIIFSLGIMAWFLPMIHMTGGYLKYKAAFDELWRFVVEPGTFWNAGLKAIISHTEAIFRFTFYGTGLGAVFILCYLLGNLWANIKNPISERSLFFLLWIMPPLLFYLFVFIQPYNPGYGLAFMPGVLIISVRALKGLTERLFKRPSNVFIVFMCLAFVFNIYIFFFSNTMVSLRLLKEEQSFVTTLSNEIRRNFSPSDTVILSRQYLFRGARHFMYYLPEFRTYLVDGGYDMEGRRRQVFWGQGRNTFLSDAIVITPDVKYFITHADIRYLIGHENWFMFSKGLGIIYVEGKEIAIYGDISLAPWIFRHIRFQRVN